MMEKKSERFETRLTLQSRQALVRLAEKSGKSKSAVIDDLIEAAARRKKCWFEPGWDE